MPRRLDIRKEASVPLTPSGDEHLEWLGHAPDDALQVRLSSGLRLDSGECERRDRAGRAGGSAEALTSRRCKEPLKFCVLRRIRRLQLFHNLVLGLDRGESRAAGVFPPGRLRPV